MQALKLATILACAAGAASALAQEGRLSAEEFDAQFIDKPFRATSIANGQVYHLLFEKGGKATVSNDYNDVGKWRPNGPAAYCVKWNKQVLTENCNVIVRREGKLAVTSAEGKQTGWIEVGR